MRLLPLASLCPIGQRGHSRGTQREYRGLGTCEGDIGARGGEMGDIVVIGKGNQLVGESVGPSVSQLFCQSVSQSAGQSVSWLVGWLVSQSVSQSVSLLVGQSVGWSVSQSVSLLFC